MPAVSRPKQIRLGIDELSWLHLTAWGAESRYRRRGKALPTYYYHVLRWLRTRLLHPMSHCLNLTDAISREKKLNGIYVPVGWKNYSMEWKSTRSWELVPEKRQGLANVLLPRITMASNSLTTSHVTLLEFDRCHFTWKSTNGWDICIHLWWPSMVGCPVALIRDVNIWLDLKWKK